MELTGTTEERIAATVEFAREHGGFERCCLFPYDSGLNVIELSGIVGISVNYAIYKKILENSNKKYSAVQFAKDI